MTSLQQYKQYKTEIGKIVKKQNAERQRFTTVFYKQESNTGGKPLCQLL